LHITQDGYALYELGENSITLSPNDMESIISSANQYARDVERIDADNSIYPLTTELLFIIEFSRLSINPVSWSKPSFVGFKSPTASDGLFLSIILGIAKSSGLENPDFTSAVNYLRGEGAQSIPPDIKKIMDYL
jgi:hypothetical protein